MKEDESCILSAEVIKEGLYDKSAETSESQIENNSIIELHFNEDAPEENVFDEMFNTEPTVFTESVDLLKMLAGYIAYKMKKQNIDSNFKYGHPTGLYPNNTPNWLSAISKGALMNPTPEWLDVVKQMENDFISFHGPESLKRDKGVMNKLFNIIKNKHEQVDEYAVTCFVRTRKFFRMKSINKKRNMKRKLYSNKESQRKLFKKLNKDLLYNIIVYRIFYLYT